MDYCISLYPNLHHFHNILQITINTIIITMVIIKLWLLLSLCLMANFLIIIYLPKRIAANKISVMLH